MPRGGRFVVPGLPLHVIQRGNNRSACFHAEGDQAFYLFHLSRALDRFDCLLHAYCLMPNHVHLLLTPSTAQACGLLMKHIGQLQTQYMNRTYKRSGALWEGRYRSSLVQSDRYLLTCYRYIELNPVRAGLAADPSQYFWSSYRTNAMGVPSGFITPHEEYVRLGTTDAERRRAYTDLVAIGVEESALHDIRQAANSGDALGDRGFRQGLSRVSPGPVPDQV